MIRRGKIVIDNFGGGWNSDFAKGANNSSPQTKPNAYYQGLFNINKSNYLGHVDEPFGNNPNKRSVDALPINAARTSNNYAHFICTNGTLPEMDVTATWAPSHSNWSAPASCATDEYKDIWTHIAPSTASTPYGECVLFTYQTTGPVAYLGYKYPGTATGRSDTYQSFQNTNVPHVGCLSTLNRSYITDGQYVRYFDPLAATPFPAVGNCLNVGIGWTTVSLCDYGNYVAIVGKNGTNARMWLWDGTGTAANFQYDLRDSDVTAIVNDSGELRVFTKGKNGTTKIKTFSGSGFTEEADWEVQTSICDAPKHGMVDIWLNQIVWRTPNGYVWTYGSPRRKELTAGAHRVGILQTDTTTNGCVKNLYQDRLFVGITNGGTAYIYEVLGSNPYSTSTGNLNLRTSLYELPHNSTIKCIHMFFSKFDYVNPSTASGVTVKLYSGYETTDLLNSYVIPNGPSSAPYKFIYHPITKSIPNLDSFYLDITKQAANGVSFTLRKIIVEYAYEDGDI